MTKSTNGHDATANAIEAAVKAGRRIVDKIAYDPLDDCVLVTCGQLTLSIKVALIPEIASLPREQIRGIELSASGASIIIKSADIYIEAAALVLTELERMLKAPHDGNIILAFLRGSLPE